MVSRTTLAEALTVSWTGSFGAITLQHISSMGTLICIVLSIIASIYAIILKRESVRKAKVELAMEERTLCEECKAGHPPTKCPIPEDERPANCPIEEDKQ